MNQFLLLLCLFIASLLQEPAYCDNWVEVERYVTPDGIMYAGAVACDPQEVAPPDPVVVAEVASCLADNYGVSSDPSLVRRFTWYDTRAFIAMPMPTNVFPLGVTLTKSKTVYVYSGIRREHWLDYEGTRRHELIHVITGLGHNYEDNQLLPEAGYEICAKAGDVS